MIGPKSLVHFVNSHETGRQTFKVGNIVNIENFQSSLYLFLFFHINLCLYWYCIYVCKCVMCVCMHVGMHNCKCQRMMLSILLYHSPLYSFETGSPTELGVRLTAASPRNPPVSVCCGTGVTGTHITMPSFFYMGYIIWIEVHMLM